jgi:hypothetical protein
MAYTYSKISSVTVGSGGSSSIDFIAIPQNYTDLVLKLSLKTDRTNAAFQAIQISFNLDTTGGNYSSIVIINSGTPVSSNNPRTVGWTATNSGTAPNVFGNFEIYIPNYNSYNMKSFSWDSVNEGNFSGVVAQGFAANLWSNTKEISSISFAPVDPNNFMQYSTATLYGIKAEV